MRAIAVGEFRTYVSVQRYLQKKDFSEKQARSFVRLFKHSRFDRQREEFQFRTTQAHQTDARLERQEGIIVWGVDPDTIGQYETFYYWKPSPAQFAGSFSAELVDLKARKEREWAFTSTR